MDNGLNARDLLDRLELLDECQAALRRLASDSAEQIASEPIKTAALERYLQIAAQVCIDVGNHIAAAYGLRSPKSYADVFQVLKEHDVLESNLADRMAELARLRNILVRLYLDVDINLLHAALRTGVDDFSLFSQQVLKFVEADKQ